VIGPDGMTWFIVGISVASFMALLILIAITCCIVSFCRNRKRVQNGEIFNSSDSSRKGDETPNSAMRLPAPGTSYNISDTRNIAEISASIQPYGH
jgi:hypothetical protein